MIKPLLARWDRFASRQSRLKHLPPRLLAHINGVDRVLDVGAGDGQVARILGEARPQARFMGVDVGVRPDARVPVQPFDGQRLPFADRSFDLVMLIDVLHHTEDPAVLLGEALRVTRGRVLVKDHHWDTPWDRWLLAVSDYLGNRPHDVPLPYAYLQGAQWTALFEALGATVAASERFRYSAVDRCKQVIYVVEPGAGVGSRSGGGGPAPRPPIPPSQDGEAPS